MILVRKDIPTHQITIDSELQVTAVKTLHKTVNICFIYIPPHGLISDVKFDRLIEQIPHLHILLGNLNCHNTIWGFLKTNKKGKDLEKIINSNNLCILNDKSPTHLNLSTIQLLTSLYLILPATWIIHERFMLILVVVTISPL